MACVKRVFAALAAAAAFAGCRTADDVMRDYDAGFAAGAYSAGAAETDSLAAKGGDDALLWHQLAGAAMRLDGDDDGARRNLDAAEHCYAANDTRGIFSRAASASFAMMTNDAMFPYDGDGVDRVFTCLYKAIDFLAAGAEDKARVELNRAMQYQKNWLYDRRKDIEAARKRFAADSERYIRSQKASIAGARERARLAAAPLADAQFCRYVAANCAFDPSRDGDLEKLAGAKAYLNPYALHLTGLFRWLAGDSDRNELRDAAALARRSRTAQRDAAGRKARETPRDQVWVYIEDGLCPRRREWRFSLPLYYIPGAARYLPYVGMALPTLEYRAAGAADWRVAGAPTELLADIDAMVKAEYDIYMKEALAREISRTVIRACMEIALGILAERHKNQDDFWAYKAAQIGVAIWAAACTKADLRSWTALPKRVLVARVARPADGRLDISCGRHALTVALPPGNSIVFIRKSGPDAEPVAKTAVFNSAGRLLGR